MMVAAPTYPIESALDLAPGLHRGVPEHVYHRPVLGLASKSGLDLVLRSPAHYYAWATGQSRDDDMPALRLGRAVHCALLEPARFDFEYTAEPEWGPCRADAAAGVTTEQGRENKKRRDEWRAARAGAPTLSAEEARIIRGMVASVLAHPLARRLVEMGAEVAESTLRWQDGPTGLACKGRLDSPVEPLACVVDLKSTQDASSEAFARSTAKFGYHRQDAFYRMGMREIGRPIRSFVFLAAEKEPPFAVALHILDEDAIALGERQNRRLLTTLSECLARGQFPAYPDTIHTLTLPRWAFSEGP